MVKSFVGFLVLVAVIALGMTLGYGPRKKAKTVLHLAPNLAELYATAAEEFDSRFAGQTVEFAGLVKNRSEETPSSGKRYLVLW
jgi:hypothetical protein